MKKEFVPFAEAQELKEIGFNQGCFAFYDEDGEVFACKWFDNNNHRINIYRAYAICTAPLFQQVFAWFREQRIFGNIEWESADPNVNCNFSIKYYMTAHLETRGTGYRTQEAAELACIKGMIRIFREFQSG